MFSNSMFMIPMALSMMVLLKISVNNFNASIMKTIFNMLESFFFKLKFNNWNKSKMNLIVQMMFMMMIFNLSSLFPYNFTLNSQVSMIMMVSLTFWITLNSFNLIYNFKSFLSHNIPEGSPMNLTLFLYLIENVSNMIRPLTLGIRMMANCMSGHLLMILISGLCLKINFFIVPTCMLMLVEIGVSIIQSYIIVTLITLYYSEL